MAQRSAPITSWLRLNRYPVFLTILTICMLTIMEMKHPCFFLGPDNLHQNLPYYVHNYRAILSGEVPLFNFHQYLGTPVLSCIQSAAFYLPNYLAVFLSMFFFGHAYATMEFIAAFHLILASIGFYKFMRYFELEQWSCCFGAIAWTFCSFVIINGNATIMMVGYAAYFPFLLLYSLRQADKFKLKYFSVLTALRTAIIFIGYPPYIIYIYSFEILTVTALYILNCYSKDRVNTEHILSQRPRAAGLISFLAKQISSYICAFIIAAPLLLPALHQISISAHRKTPFSWKQYSENSYKLNDWLNGLFNPIPAPDDMYTGYGMTFLSHVGWLTVIIATLSIILLWQRNTHRKTLMVFWALAIFSFLWANDTFITELFYHVPYYNRQRWPFKLAYFTSFFIVVLSSFGFEYLVGKIKSYGGSSKVTVVVIVSLMFSIHICGYLLIYLTYPQINMEIRRTKLPVYNEPLIDNLNTGRIVSIVSTPTAEDLLSTYGENYANTRLLGFDYATLFDLYHFAGYEVLVSEKNLRHALDLNNSAYLHIENVFSPSAQDLEYFRKWGVRWYVVASDVPIAKPHLLQTFSTDEHRTVMYDPEAKPFAFWSDDKSEQGIRYRFTANSILISAQRETGGDINVNVLHNPFFSATIDGKKADIFESTDNQMVVSVPSGHHEVLISYIDPYFHTGMYVSTTFLILVSGGWFILRSINSRRQHRTEII